jgi:hypothetical protein
MHLIVLKDIDNPLKSLQMRPPSERTTSHLALKSQDFFSRMLSSRAGRS